MKKYQMPAIKMMAIAAETVVAASADFELDERGVFDVYAPVANFE
jgi:hypothetical protein